MTSKPGTGALPGDGAHRPAVRVRIGNWDQLGGDASALRTRVFVEEQQIPAELEWDEADAKAVHAVAYDRLGQPVATGRLLRAGEGVAKIGRMAVDRKLRGTGVGRQVLLALANEAAGRGDRQLVLHAQRSAEGFYLRLGFRFQGEPFEEAGIPHIEMVAGLPLAA